MPSLLLALIGLAALAEEPQAVQPPPSTEPALEPGRVHVRPFDPNGVLVGGATAWLSREGRERIALAPSPDGGLALDVPPGRWRLEVSAPLFVPWSSEVEVEPGETLAVPLQLTFDASTSDEIVVVAPTDVLRLEHSAQSVTVVETEHARKQAADLGEVMARTQGVSVRRSGGLGSGARFSLNGLTDEQVRFFLDGVPLHLAGFPFGIANVPLGLVERVDVYKGVVPVRFGADALGGAVDLVTVAPEGVGGSLSYQVGSFDTHRASAHVYASDDATGLRARAVAFVDSTRNDYPVDVEVADESGRLAPATVHRFHDGYRARGGSLELGVAERRWADTLTVRGFASGSHREIQNNVVMTVPYGEPTSRIRTAGGSALWRHTPTDALEIELLAAGTRTTRGFTDVGECVYDWFGRCVRDRAVPGEIATPATDRLVWDRAGLARGRLQWRPASRHRLTLSVAPTFFSRTGEDLLHDGTGRDPLTSRRDALQVVTGLEHTVSAPLDVVENRLFVKHYLHRVASEEPLPGGTFRSDIRTTDRFGIGDGLRVDLTDHVWLKAAYEWATRLPSPEEIFGDAVLVVDNLELVPETSHNVNLGITVRAPDTPSGAWRVDADGFLRQARDLIVLLGTDRYFAHYNVFGARSLGVEGAAGWTSPGEWVGLHLNGTWLDLRNSSSDGTFGAYAGDRIPNRPWLFANANLRLGASDLAAPGDRLTLDVYTRYVHPFYRGWESVGLAEFKQTVPAQLWHTAALTYAVGEEQRRVGATVEVQNLTDAKVFDYFGVQRPGRAIYGKLTVSR